MIIPISRKLLLNSLGLLCYNDKCPVAHSCPDPGDKNPKDRGIIPDYPIVLTPEMVYSDHDFIIDHALEIIRSSAKMQE